MFRTTLAILIAAAILATTLIAIGMTTSVFASNGQSYAPGQAIPHNNPSSPDTPPPGNNGEESLGNPGQCQKFLNGPAFDIDKQQAHSECH
jgi:hypothetical protein